MTNWLHLQNIPSPTQAGPLATLQAIAERSPADYAMLHSAAANANGFSVIGFDPLVTLNVNGDGGASWTGAIGAPEGLKSLTPLKALESAIGAISFETVHPLIGWLGFISYDIARHLENVPALNPDTLKWPLIRFSLFRHYLLFEPGGTAQVFSLASDGETQTAGPPTLSPPTSGMPGNSSTLIDALSRPTFEVKIGRVKEYIAAGDIYQANLAQRWSFETTGKPHDIFRKLCEVSPAPYASCIRFTDAHGTRHVVSASPELFLLAQNGRMLTKPIKGTRPRELGNAQCDEALRSELLRSAKDKAELTMIVDLLRNDLGRVSQFGTVRVSAPRDIERHPTVWHTVATLESKLRPEVGLAELLTALCPGGSITGAPKIRAMQIIEELEGFRRALYCGNIGVISPGGSSLALNIAIRTILFDGNQAHVFAGGGIVADSDPAHEYDETLHKAAALFKALGAPLPV